MNVRESATSLIVKIGEAEARLREFLAKAVVAEGDGGVDEVAAQRPQPRKGSLFVGARESALADHVRDENRREFAGFAHGANRLFSLAQRRPT